jgi:TfoX/Sxy family transcriptional regulator of competence genes
MAYDDHAAERVRLILSGQREIAKKDLVEKRLMGGLIFMVRGNMCCGIRVASIMVRVGPESYERTLTQPHVRPLEFAGRRPKGYVVVDPPGYQSDAALKTWIKQSLDFVLALPEKKSAAKKPQGKRPS